jgi:hypothetical protein
MDWLVVLFFAVWAGVSILVLFPKMTSRLRQRDIFGLVPEWKFFAPIPGRGDFHFLYRDFYPEGCTAWTEIEVGGRRRWWNFLWHPNRRDRKAAFDAAREMYRFMMPEHQSQLQVSVPYLSLLCYVCGQARTLIPLQTQFLLLYSEAAYADGEPQISLLSSTHDFSSSE